MKCHACDYKEPVKDLTGVANLFAMEEEESKRTFLELSISGLKVLSNPLDREVLGLFACPECGALKVDVRKKKQISAPDDN